MFTIPRINVIKSDEGFSVEVLGRTGLRYTEGNRELLINSELLNGPAGLIVYSSSMVEWNNGDKLEKSDKMRVVDNITRSFQYRGIEIQIV